VDVRKTAPVHHGIELIRERLDDLAEELADVALDLLREAVEGGPDGDAAAARDEERRVTRARRAVEKASVLLTAGGDAGDDG